MTFAQLVNGVSSLARSALGLDLADAEVIAARRRTCDSCDAMAIGTVTGQAVCGECGCFIVPKTRLADQRCPIGRW